METDILSEIISSGTSTPVMPVLFVGHGNPMNAIIENEFVKGWRNIGKTLPKPAAILCISAHWETNGTYVTAMEKPKTIHDFGGFPKALYEVKYPAPGNPALANEAKSIIKKTVVGLDQQWGLDHGCWSILLPMFPDADVPVIQMSIDYSKPAQYHYELAKELTSLREKGVLIIGSGNMVHNLGLVAWDRINDESYGFDWALEANDDLRKFILSGDHQSLFRYDSLSTALRMAVPTPDHYLPMIYSLALKKENENISLFNDKIVMGSVSMTSFKISA